MSSLKKYVFSSSLIILRDRPWPARPVRGQAKGRTCMYYLYILKSVRDSNHYVGITSNLKNRLAYHNKGLVRSTKSRIPFMMIYSEEFVGRTEARNREIYLKSYKGSKEKLEIIENCGIV